HPSDRCPKIVREPVVSISTDKNSDGFTEVKKKKHKGTIRRGADMDSMTKVGINAINKIKGAIKRKNKRRGLKCQLNEYVESDDEVDEFIFPKGDKFSDKFDIRLKAQLMRDVLEIGLPILSLFPHGNPLPKKNLGYMESNFLMLIVLMILEGRLRGHNVVWKLHNIQECGVKKQALKKFLSPVTRHLHFFSFILDSLSSEFQAFVQNYNMQLMEKTMSEVHSLLIEFEKSIKRNKQPIFGASSTPQVMAIQGGRVQKYKLQGKAKGKGLQGKAKGKGLQAKLMKKKKKTGGQNVASTSSGIYTIELFAFLKNSWVYDTGCGTYICNTKQGLRGAKKLKRGSLYLYVGNGVRAKVEAIESFYIVLPNGLIIILDNCHYAPSITRGIVSVSRLVDKGFTQCFTNFGLSVSMNNMSYFNAITVNGIYEIDMRDSTLPIVNSIHVSKKGASYFITFTDDYSRYGYVYLLKHKHEVFETFKDYALESVARILNTVPTKKVDKTLYELWHGKVPNLSYLKVWGCEAHVKCHTPDQLQQRSVKCIFVGYLKETMGYYFYYPPKNKIVVERSVRTHKAPDRLCLNVEIDSDRLCFNVEVEEHSLGDLNEPANYKASLSDPEFEKWLVAMNAEMQSMYDNKV
nr:hypothetical protein [Tanacetum cinerariifolium]